MRRRTFLQTMSAGGIAAAFPLMADEQLAGVACRSVHLGFSALDAIAFYNEVTVQSSAPGTYFMVCGWSRGYFGIQELASRRKVILFSVWDSSENDANAAPTGERVVSFEPAEGVTVRRFGNEGSGGQSLYDYEWKVDETYRFCVSSEPSGNRIAYSGWFYHPERKSWLRLMTFAVPTLAPEKLTKLYSFVEDFRRNRESTKHARVARFANAWTLSDAGIWAAVSDARFTGDDNPATNINACIVDGGFVLATGGMTENTDAHLRERLTLMMPPSSPPGWKPMRVMKEKTDG